MVPNLTIPYISFTHVDLLQNIRIGRKISLWTFLRKNRERGQTPRNINNANFLTNSQGRQTREISMQFHWKCVVPWCRVAHRKPFMVTRTRLSELWIRSCTVCPVLRILATSSLKSTFYRSSITADTRSRVPIDRPLIPLGFNTFHPLTVSSAIETNVYQKIQLICCGKCMDLRALSRTKGWTIISISWLEEKFLENLYREINSYIDL